MLGNFMSRVGHPGMCAQSGLHDHRKNDDRRCKFFFSRFFECGFVLVFVRGLYVIFGH